MQYSQLATIKVMCKPIATPTNSSKMEKKVHPVSMRLTDSQYTAMQTIGAKLRMPITNLISLAVDGFADYYRAHDGRITLPLDFTHFFTDARHLLELAQARDSVRDDYIDALREALRTANLPIPEPPQKPAADAPALRVAEDPADYS